MKRISTGVPGLDSILEGGFPHPGAILLTGPTGSGKTIFGLQFLYNGARENREAGFMASFAGFQSDLYWYNERFGWDIKAVEDEGLLIVSKYDPVDFEKFDLRTLHSEVLLQISKVVDSIGAKRVVFDSITPLGYFMNDKSKYRTTLYYLAKALKDKGVTTLFITEQTAGSLTPFEIEPYLMDGVLEMGFTQKEGMMMPTLAIKKMIATPTPQSRFLVDISDEGLKVLPGLF